MERAISQGWERRHLGRGYRDEGAGVGGGAGRSLDPVGIGGDAGRHCKRLRGAFGVFNEGDKPREPACGGKAASHQGDQAATKKAR